MTSSTDSSLPFVDRAKLALQEQTENYKKRQEDQKQRARVILDTVDVFGKTSLSLCIMLTKLYYK